MKSKKALKKLSKVEALLSHVIEGFPGSENGVGQLLGTAKSNITRAIETVNASTETPPKKSNARPKKASKNTAPNADKTRSSVTARKRMAAPKRKSVRATPDQALSQTA